MGDIVVVKGISGSGKSSRVFQFLKYCESIGFTLSDFKFINHEGKEKVVGILIDELNLVFIGKIYKTGDVERWQGYDVMTGAFGKASYFSDFLEEYSQKYSFLVEGAGITQTHRLRPAFLKGIGFDRIYVQYYNYPIEGKVEYYKRIIYRSGEKPKKDVMWDKNVGFIKDSQLSLEDKKELIEADPNIVVRVNEFDEPMYDFGVQFFSIFGYFDEIEPFKKFVSKFDYINTNKFENFNK